MVPETLTTKPRKRGLQWTVCHVICIQLHQVIHHLPLGTDVKHDTRRNDEKRPTYRIDGASSKISEDFNRPPPPRAAASAVLPTKLFFPSPLLLISIFFYLWQHVCFQSFWVIVFLFVNRCKVCGGNATPDAFFDRRKSRAGRAGEECE